MKEHHTDCITDAKQITTKLQDIAGLEDAKVKLWNLWDF